MSSTAQCLRLFSRFSWRARRGFHSTLTKPSAAGAAALLLTLALTACGGGDSSPASSGQPASAAQTPTPPPAPEPATAPAAAEPDELVTKTSPPGYQWDALGVGKPPYVDAASVFTRVPGRYKGLTYLQTAAADVYVAASAAVEFEVNAAVAVLVGYASRGASSLPSWLASWADTGDTLETSTATLNLYRKEFAAGPVRLGGNELGFDMYTVIIDDGTGMGNTPPTISGNAPAEIGATRGYAFSPSATDGDGDALTFTATNLPPWAAIDTATGAVTGTPAIDQTGTYADVVITVSDGATATSLPPFSIAVTGADTNSAPTITGTPSTSIVAGQPYSFTPSAADADDDPLTFSISNRPAWASFSSSTGSLTGAPGAAGAFNNIVIRVTDGEVTTALPAFSITVTAASPPPAPASPTTPTTPPPPAPNAAPTITGAPANTVNQSQAYAFTPSANDTDGDTLTFSITNRPTWATFNANTGRLSGTPSGNHVGVHDNITISVSDGEASASLAAFSVTVQAVNSPPTITGAPATSVMQNQPYSFTPSADDADDDTLTFSITNRPGWASFNSSTGRLSGTPDAGDVGAYHNIVISVSDGQASRSLAAFGISVVATATGSATLTWTPPTRNTDGSTLTNLAGYKIHWGRSQGNYTSSVTVNNPGLATYVVDDLTSGTWWFAVSARNSAGAESQLSNAASKTIQ